jgi:hypothetical protein
MRAAAKLIGVTPGALSRRNDVERISAGREQRIPAAEVVRLAGVYRRRSPSRVAAELVEHALSVDSALEIPISHEVDGALEQVPVAQPGTDITVFLETAHRLLPETLAQQVEAAVQSQARGESAVGWSPASK